MEILNAKVERATKEKIDRLVKSKGYKNRSEAIRTIIEDHLFEHPELYADSDIQELVKEADRVTVAELDKLAERVFKGHKRTAAELVKEERER